MKSLITKTLNFKEQVDIEMPRRNKVAKHLDRVRPRKDLNQSNPEISIDSNNNNISENNEIIDVSESSVDFTEDVNVVHIPESLSVTNVISQNAEVTSLSESSTDANNTAISTADNVSTNTVLENVNIPNASESDRSLEKKRVQLINRIKLLPDDEILAACHLFETMIYSDGKREGKILSPYLINKAKDFIIDGLHKRDSSSTAMRYKINLLERENRKLRKKKNVANSRIHSLTMKVVKSEETKARYIKKIRSIIRKKKDISPELLRQETEKLIKENKKEYTAQFVQLAVELSHAGIASISSTAECIKKVYTF